MTRSGFLKPAGIAGLLVLAVATSPRMALADDAGAAVFSAGRAVLAGQRAKSAANPERQLGLVRSRLESTRGARVEGRNVNSSTLAMRFSGGSSERSAAYETKHLLAPEEARRTRRSAIWLGGDVTLDSERAEDPRRAALYTNGIAFGADTRIGDRLLVGNAVGMAFDRTGIGAEGSLQTRTLSDTLYGSLTTSRDTYLDMMLGVSRSDFRNDLGTDALSTGARSATHTFGMARFSREFRREQVRVRPYGQARYQRSHLSAYSAEAEETYRFAPYASDALELTLGVRSDTSTRTRRGKVAPHATLEVSRTVKRSTGAVVSSIEGIEDVATPSHDRSSRLSARTGLNWTITDRASVNGEYSVSSSLGGFETKQQVSARFKLKF
jgi:outer membrane autotransporter protein